MRPSPACYSVSRSRYCARNGPAGRRPGPGLAEHFEHRFRPISAGIAVPVFALLSAGFTVGGVDGLTSALTDPIAVGIMIGLIVGKPVGILLAAWLTARFTRATIDPGLSWIDMAGLAVLAGIGFTVSLLIGELAFGIGGDRDDHVKVAVLLGSLVAAVLASVVLRARNRVYRRIREAEQVDRDRDGIPDIYQS